ncbi:DUF2061 domain-containing protein [Maribacter arcticus]|jgi:uncharacterized membrane protein|uniref:DUF2061 domain-containing protein n=1 Tax=Maribacter arcticus TaxID=561365 RepID=UPI0030032D49
MKDNSHKRHMAKAITWRIIGTLDTIILSWVISGNPWIGLKIGISEVATKMILYYIHERLWFKINIPSSNKRHVLKTISWRTVGSLDTFILAWIISGNPITGIKIGTAEVLTKMIFYYLHERLWYLFDYGLEKNYRIKR